MICISKMFGTMHNDKHHNGQAILTECLGSPISISLALKKRNATYIFFVFHHYFIKHSTS